MPNPITFHASYGSDRTYQDISIWVNDQNQLMVEQFVTGPVMGLGKIIDTPGVKWETADKNDECALALSLQGRKRIPLKDFLETFAPIVKPDILSKLRQLCDEPAYAQALLNEPKTYQSNLLTLRIQDRLDVYVRNIFIDHYFRVSIDPPSHRLKGLNIIDAEASSFSDPDTGREILRVENDEPNRFIKIKDGKVISGAVLKDGSNGR